MKKIKALLKSKVGMTFVELLTALALLVIIITSFTPMLLNSYETLYKAGEINEETYAAKTEIEEVLAGRDSDIISRYKVSFENLTNTMFLNMRKAMENCQNGIQTVFYGGKGTITVVSQSVIPDDEPFKDVTVQFNGINITSVVEGNSSNAAKNGNEYTVAIQIVTPTWGADTASGAEAFDPTKNSLDTSKYDANLVVKSGKKYADIKIKDGVDVITTAVKIIAHFYDENGKLEKAEAYVRITPATIMLVGKTSSSGASIEDSFDANNNGTIEENEKYTTSTNAISYYTSKGVDKREVAKDITDSNGNVIKTETSTAYRFKAFPRELRTANNPAGTRYPDGTEFLSVSYIDNDKDLNLVPYYVLTGTNGVIQRLFISTGNISGITNVTGYTENELRSVEYKDGGLTKKLYPSFWGGDKSHQFGYSTFSAGDFDTTTGYYNEDDIASCWYTGDKETASGLSDKNIYNIQARYSMYFNGFGAWCKEEMRNGRRISYVLIEAGVPLRLTGTRVDDSDLFGGFLRCWEGESGIHTIKNDDESHWSDTKKVIRVINNDKDNESDNERAFAFLRLISYGNAPLSELLDDAEDNSQVQYLNNSESTNVNVTASLYNSASGQMMYLGTVPAQGFVQQVDNISSSGNYAGWFQPETNWLGTDKKYIPLGGYTGYLINGSKDGGTTITKLCVESDRGLLLQSLRKSQGLSSSTSYSFGTKEFYTDTTTESLNRATFFVERTYSGTADTSNTFYKLVDNDLEFTLGYSSNREQVFANITYGTNKVEYHNYYERYFNNTHYGDINRSNDGNGSGTYDDIPNSYYLSETSNLINSKDSSLYNVWFPGEFYNLTQTATKEGITVAVGYTVSGSSYQRFQSGTTNSSTALGGVFNDGVLAVMPSDQSSFTNVLYYKDYDNFQDKDITGNSHLTSTLSSVYNNNYSSGYGTHARASVRFTAVDILFLGGTYNHETNQMDQKSIYAIYGDNHGRVFFSLVAQVNYTGVGENEIGTPTITSNVSDTAWVNDSSGSLGGLSSVIEFTDVNDQSLSTHFSEITSITVDEQTIYVTGKGNGVNQDPTLAVCNINGGANLKFTVITLVHNAAVYQINDMIVLGGYLYFAGDVAGNTGFWCAVDTGILDNCIENGYKSLAEYAIANGITDATDPSAYNPATNIKLMPYQDLPTPINSIAGRNT